MLPELTAFCSTNNTFKNTGLSFFDSIYLGNPYCLSIKDNLITDKKNLKICVRELKKRGIKAFVTSPIVPIGNDLNLTRKMLDTAADENIDGVEVFDMGIFRMIRKNFPELKIHIGHYANVYNKFSAKAFLSLGASRIIPNYELTFDEAKTLTNIDNLEIEVAIHGRLPLGYANACLLRLEFPSRKIKPCTQQCSKNHFLEYSDWNMYCAGPALLMGKDTCMIDRLPQYVNAGFRSLRLDTSTDNAEKISRLGRLYRKALNIIKSNDEYPANELLDEAKNISGDICNGWQTGASGRDFISPNSTPDVEQRERATNCL